MKKFLLITVSFFFFCPFFAQNLKTSFSNLSTYARYAYIKDVGTSGENIIVITSESRRYQKCYMNIYDKATMTLKSSRIFKDAYSKDENCIDKHFYYIGAQFLKKNIYLLFQTYETSSKSLQLFTQKIDKDGNFVGKFNLIDQIDSKSNRNVGGFKITCSEDSTKLLIVDVQPYDRYNGEKFNFKIYDNSMVNKSNFGVSLPYKDKNLTISDYYIGNDSKIHLFTSIYLDKKEQQAGQAASFYSVFTINPNDKSVAEYKLDLPNRSIENASIRIDNKNKNFICCGFYSDLKARAKVGKDIDGFYYLKVDIDKRKIETQGTKPIDKDMIAELNNKKVKGDRGIAKSFGINDIETHKDGTMTIIAENRRDEVVSNMMCSSTGCTYYTTYYYYRDNIFLINVSSDGTIKSFTDIPKRQVTTDDGGIYLSFLTFKKNGRLIFIYNDNPKNLDPSVKTIKDAKKLTNVRGGVAVATEVNKDGGYSKSQLFENKAQKMTILPESGFKIGDGVYIVPTMLPPAISCSLSCFGLFSRTKLGIAKIEMK